MIITKAKLVLILVAVANLGCSRATQKSTSAMTDSTLQSRRQRPSTAIAQPLPIGGSRLYPLYKGMYLDVGGTGCYIELEVSPGPTPSKFLGKGRLAETDFEDARQPIFSPFSCTINMTSDSTGEITVESFTNSSTTHMTEIKFQVSNAMGYALSALWGTARINVNNREYKGTMLLHCFGS